MNENIANLNGELNTSYSFINLKTNSDPLSNLLK